jgi:ketosteroid isomerase-like protein
MKSHRRKENMKKLAGVVLLVCACVGLAFAQTKTTPAKAPAAGPSISSAIKQLEHDWTDAMIAGDTDKLNGILADDWAGLDADGNKSTKQEYIAAMKSGDMKLASFEFGPMEVKVMGSVAVCQGSDTEKSTGKGGKDTSGKYVWMDVFAKRGDKWVAVRSQDAMVK